MAELTLYDVESRPPVSPRLESATDKADEPPNLTASDVTVIVAVAPLEVAEEVALVALKAEAKSAADVATLAADSATLAAEATLTASE